MLRFLTLQAAEITGGGAWQYQTPVLIIMLGAVRGAVHGCNAVLHLTATSPPVLESDALLHHIM